jgi:SAM-dependent methyltransferase
MQEHANQSQDAVSEAVPEQPRLATRDETDDPAYWNQVYEEAGDESPGWDLGGPNPELVWQLGHAVPAIVPGRIVVPGCGQGHDVALLAAMGFEVLGVDVAPLAVARAGQALERLGLRGEVREADFFRLGDTHAGAFDYVYEYTCFCAIHPDRRREYAETVRRILKPGGQLIGCFYHHQKPGGPPFDTTPEQIRAAFGGLMELQQLTVAQNSVERRMGMELWARFFRP